MGGVIQIVEYYYWWIGGRVPELLDKEKLKLILFIYLGKLFKNDRRCYCGVVLADIYSVDV